MTTIHLTLCINHRGQFERGPCGKLSYVGGEVTEIERINVDTLNDFFVSDLVKEIGYTSVTNFFWLEPGKELDDGLRDLKVDMDIVRMYEAAVKNSNRINVYTEHPVNESVLVEENNMTLSKMRVKRCTRRVPTPKKSPKRRLIVVEDKDDAEIISNLQVRKEDRKRSSEAQSREEAYEAHKQAGLEAQKKDNISQSFIPNPDPDKPPTFYVPVDDDDFSDENPGHHCYESEELHSIASDDDTEQTPIFSQSNVNAPVNQVRLEVGMEFETLSHFRKAVRKFNINIGKSIFFSRCDSTRSKAICYDEDCPWQIYCAKRTFPASFQVKTFLNEHTCSRDNHCLPCRHACAALAYQNRRPEEYAHNWLTMGAYNAAYQTSMRPVPSQEYLEHDVDTLPILPPRYRKPIGRPTLKRDKRNDGPKEKSDPHRTTRRIGTIICIYCLQAGHNKRSCKKRKEAAGEGSSIPQAQTDAEDEDMMAEMYYEETLESAEAEQEATEDGNQTARTNTQQVSALF
ncbi:hypothetical protein Ahy_A04g017845 [Arachis hypogaea]|uniref:Uncharacterized protein n=1 Tax=Arachis hypogaea TaxID=3818 RepID=A0A445DC93_ARAHY|nr:hypothetical protein Ahy_A04g017845 [Arachis hypogaea]